MSCHAVKTMKANGRWENIQQNEIGRKMDKV